jgi:rhamnogalacturonan endolyase
MKRETLFGLLICGTLTVVAQPRYELDKMCREQLNRGVVAIRNGNQVVVSWRTLTSDTIGEPFNVYRNGELLTATALTRGGTFFIDEQPLAGTATYDVRGGGKNGSYTLPADAPDGYLSIPLQKPEGGTTPDGRTFTYSANDASVGDVDGDGTYEVFLKWDPSNAHDNAHDGFTGPTLIDCYNVSDGKLLWRINLGINIRSGAHYTQFMVYDFDGDGRAELMVKTGDGTIDGQGNVIGDATADHRHGVNEAKNKQAQDNATSDRPFARREEWARYNKGHRAKTGRILSGPEYISVFDGLTGRVLDTKPYVPERGNLEDWGDAYANRSDRFLAAVGYLGHTTTDNDKRLASGIFCRGYYTRTVIAAWDWDGRQLSNRWTFDTNTPEWNTYAGQGNHNLRIADVDGDGFDEITYGSMAVDHDGRGLYNTGFGHGDALHLTVFDPTSDRLQVWDCHENRRDGSDFRDAATGEVIFQVKSPADVGRAMAADIDPTNPGLEMWSSDSHGIRNIKGEVLGVNVSDSDDPQHHNTLVMNGRHLSVNFGIWWDGDLLRELLDRETVSKYNWEQGIIVDLQKFDGKFNNGSKSNPCLSADILGDWREEVLIRNRESTELRLYVTTIPTDYRINCLMEDIPYRLSVASENTAYNQPPETGFYLGPDNSVTSFLK